MNGSRTTLGLCMACALLVSAFAAQSASAETTAFTCSDEALTKTFADAHCTKAEPRHQYGHLTIPADTTTEVTTSVGTSDPSFELKATINGINTVLTTESVSGAGSMHNETVSGEMKATAKDTVTYTGLKVAAPAGKGCKVYTDNSGVKGEESVVHSNELKSETTNEMGLKIQPAAGETLATFIIDGCGGSEALEGLNKTYSVTGSVIGEPKGGEVVFTHANTTTQNTLKINGSIKAGVDGSTTIQGKHSGEQEYKALSVTTPEAGGVYKEDG